MDPTDAPDPSSERDTDEVEPRKRKKRRGYVARLEPGTREGQDVLVVETHEGKAGVLPSVCLKCGAHKDILRRSTTFRWSPRWARLLVFCFIGLVLLLVMRNEAEIDVPLCPACSERWTRARAALVGGVLALGGALVGVRAARRPVEWLPAFAVSVIAFAVVVVTFVKPRTLQVHKIDDRHIYLKGVHAGAALEVVEGSS